VSKREEGLPLVELVFPAAGRTGSENLGYLISIRRNGGIEK